MKLINKSLAGHTLAIASDTSVMVDENGEVEVVDETHAKILAEVGFKAVFTKREAKAEVTAEVSAEEPAGEDAKPEATATTHRRRGSK